MSVDRDGRELGPPLEAHRFGQAALADYLVTRIPGFDRNFTIEQFRGGQSNPTFLIKSQSGSYVLRKKPPGELLPSAHAVDREYTVISALAASPVPVPRAHLLCEDDSIIGQMFYIMDYVPGRVLSDPAMPSSNPQERAALYKSMIETLGILHAVDYNKAGLESFGYPSGYVARQVKRWSKQYEASKLEDFETMDRLIEWLPENNPDDHLASIVHGDFRPGNIIFHGDRPDLLAVLDWELSTIGHPLADLGYFLMPYHLETGRELNGILGLNLDALGIPSKSALLETYAKSAGYNEAPAIDFYVVFSMFRLASILAGVLRRGIEGNAADPRALERGKTYKLLAENAWAIVSKL